MLFVDNITELEHNAIQSFFEKKMIALQKSQQKDFGWIGFDKSKYLKTQIDNHTFIVGAGNVFRAIMEDILTNASTEYPECFGTRDAMRVVEAIYNVRPWGQKEHFKDFLQNEHFALVFKIYQHLNIEDKVLRIDLFRDIKPELGNPKYNEFIGGLLHSFKHFSWHGNPLSTNLENYNIDHPNKIFELIIKGFFFSKHLDFERRKGLNTIYPLDSEKDIKCAFYKEEKSGVYFLNTLHIKTRKLPRKEKKKRAKNKPNFRKGNVKHNTKTLPFYASHR